LYRLVDVGKSTNSESNCLTQMKQVGLPESETGANPKTPNLNGPKPTNKKKTPMTRSVAATPNASTSTTILALPPKTPIPLAQKLAGMKTPQALLSRTLTPKLSEPLDITKSCPIAILKPRKIPQKIMIHIGTLTGKTFSLVMMSTDTIGDIKNRIQDEEGLLVESQILVYREQQLKNDQASIESHGIQNDSKLQLVLHMAGGLKV
jgi:Ubiquitin family